MKPRKGNAGEPDSLRESNDSTLPAAGVRSQEPSAGVTRRAVAIGLLLIPLNVYWIIAAELRWYLILTLNPLFVTPVFYLFMLVTVNGLLRRIAPRAVLSGPELVTIYLCLVLSCTVATHDFLINLASTVAWPRWFATPSNGWESRLFPYLPRWLFVWDRAAMEGAFTGNSSLYRADRIVMWLRPFAAWSIFIFALGWTTFCLSALLRRAWVDRTRLSFPIVRLPLSLTGDPRGGATLRSKMLWLGFAVATAIQLTNGLNVWVPNVPHFQVLARPITLPSPPWTAAAPMFFTAYPFAIGLAFLVPLDVSFSCWFFYLFIKAQAVTGAAFGYGGVPDFPFVSEQAIGAWYAFGFVLLWGMRGYFKEVLRIALRPKRSDSRLEDAGEPLPYRLSLIGAIGGAGVMTLFWWAAGMSLHWALLSVITYLLLAICITRVRAEAGGQHTVWDLEPMRLFRLFGSQSLGPGNLAGAAMSHWYWRLNRSHPMPSQLEAFVLAGEHRMSLRSLALPMMAAFVISTVCGIWACLHVFYVEGATAKCQGFPWWNGLESFNWLDTSLSSGFAPQWHRWGAVGFGALFLSLLSIASIRFIGFPFHPLGYCIGPGLIWLWFPFFVAWLVKLHILRYGGLRLYRQVLPFFLGLILGDYVSGALWSLVSVFGGIPSYHLFH